MTLKLSPASKKILRSIPDRVANYESTVELLKKISTVDSADASAIEQLKADALKLLKTTSK